MTQPTPANEPTPMTLTERILIHELRYIASISTGQIQHVAKAAVARAVAAHGGEKGTKP